MNITLTEIKVPAVKVIVTFGPTDESIDDVMKITNMSTGKLGIQIAMELVRGYKQFGEIELWLVGNKTAYSVNRFEVNELKRHGVHCVQLGGVKDGRRVLSETEDLRDVLKDLMSRHRIDYVFHSAAVGDYTGRFATNNRLLAEEIHELYTKAQADGTVLSAEAIAEVLAAPTRVFNQDCKMSSDEPHMIVGLGLTPKVIAGICGYGRDKGYETRLISWKLLSGVSREELINVAAHHGQRNGSWRVVANDLDRIGDGKHWALILDPAGGQTVEAQTKEGIASALFRLLLPSELSELLNRADEIGFKLREDARFEFVTDGDGNTIGAAAIEDGDVLLHLASKYQGQGLGRHAVNALADRGFRLYAHEGWGNASAYEKFGLNITGNSDEHGCLLFGK